MAGGQATSIRRKLLVNARRKARALIVAAVACAVLAAAQVAPAQAAVGGTGHTVTSTDHMHSTRVETGDTDFCTGEQVTPQSRVTRILVFKRGGAVM